MVSGWEGKTDWYRNIEHEPALEVRTGRVAYRPIQEFLSPDETARFIFALFRQHPRQVRFVGRLLGIDSRGGVGFADTDRDVLSRRAFPPC